MSTKRSGDVEENCPKCLNLVKTEDQAMECEMCEKWFHIGCAGMAVAVYKGITKAGSGLHWFCGECDGKASELLKSLNTMKGKQEQMYAELETVKISMADFRKEIKADIDELKKEAINKTYAQTTSGISLKGNMPQAQMLVQNDVVERNLQMQITERIEIEKRKTNLIVMGINELEENEDSTKIESILEYLMPDIQIKYEIVGRVGVKKDKIRPLRIKIDDHGHRTMILRRAKTLKENSQLNKIFLCPDLTRKQQEEDKIKRDEVKRLRLEGHTSARIERGVVVRN